VTSNLAVHSPIIGRWKQRLSSHVMPVVHNSATEMTQDKPEHSRKNRLERWIHQARLMEGMGRTNKK